MCRRMPQRTLPDGFEGGKGVLARIAMLELIQVMGHLNTNQLIDAVDDYDRPIGVVSAARRREY